MRFLRCSFALIACLIASGLTINFQCSSLKDYPWSVIGNAITCQVSNIASNRKCVAVTPANSNTMNRVEVLWIQWQEVHYMPSFTDQLASRLKGICINNCHMKSIDRDDLRQFSQLKYLNLGFNDLETLSSDLFDFTPNIEFIGFHNNKLNIIGDNILQPLTSLKQASFNNAECISFHGNTAKMQSLRSQLMTKCKSTQVKANVSEQLKKIEALEEQLKQQIYESEVEISTLKKQLTRKLNNCDKNFDLAARSLEALRPRIVTSSTDKPKIDIICGKFSSTENVCEAIDLTIAHPTTDIASVRDENRDDVWPTTLVIKQQAVLYLPTNLGQVLPELIKFDLTKSGIFVISSRAFRGLEQLENLNLRENNIFVIEKESFVDLKNLAVLDLSYNKLDSINTDAFNGLVELKVLHLNDNILKSISAEAFSSVTHLEYLDLSSNLIETLPFESFKSLNLLKVLMLSFNRISALKSDILSATAEIEVFKIDNNKLDEIDVKVLTFFKNSDEIDLSKNYCISTKYQKPSVNISQALMGFHGAVSVNCSEVVN